MKIEIIGVSFGIAGLLSDSLGCAFQKKASRKEQLSSGKFYMLTIKGMGIIGMIFSVMCLLISAAMLKISTIGILMPAGVIFKIILERLLLKEKISRGKIVAICMFVLGIIGALQYALKCSNTFNPNQFQELFYNPLVGGYLISNLIVMLIGFPIGYCIGKEFIPQNEYSEFIDEENEAQSTAETEASDVDRPARRLDMNRGLSHQGMSFSGSQEGKESKWIAVPLVFYIYYGAFFLGIFLGLFKMILVMAFSAQTSGSYSNFDGLMPKFLIAATLMCPLLSVLILNKSKKHFDSNLVASILDMCKLFHCLLSGAILLGEFRDFHAEIFDLGMFFLGVAFSLNGIVVFMGDQGVSRNYNPNDK